MARSARDGGRTSVAGGFSYYTTYYDKATGDPAGDYATITLQTSLYLGGPDPATQVTLWGKGVLSVGAPTTAQQRFMASYAGGELSGFPDAISFLAPGAAAQSYDTIALRQNATYVGSDDSDLDGDGFVPGSELSVTWQSSAGTASITLTGSSEGPFGITNSAPDALRQQVRAGQFAYTRAKARTRRRRSIPGASGSSKGRPGPTRSAAAPRRRR